MPVPAKHSDDPSPKRGGIDMVPHPVTRGGCLKKLEGRWLEGQPRPMNGILVAMMVMNCTLESKDRLSM